MSSDVISGKVLSCLRKFRDLQTELEVAAAQADNETVTESLPSSRVQDELGRYKVWAANIGAHRTGKSSLEYRLRDASHIRSQVLRLLDDLSESLTDAASILRGERTPWDELSSDGEIDFLDDIGDQESLAPVPGTELSQILADLTEAINCLFRLSLSIRNPAPHDRFRQTRQTDTSYYEPSDVNHVKDKFPAAPSQLSERVGKAISYRRQFFKYRELHHQKLAHGLDEHNIDDGRTSTVASTIPNQHKDAAATGRLNEPIDEDQSSEAGMSQTSYALSSETARDRPKIPPLPKQDDEGYFECPFCYRIILATTTRAWRKHVFGDLQPYICLESDCRAVNHIFSRRRRWMEHFMADHWRVWLCPLGCSHQFHREQDAKQHLESQHYTGSITPRPTAPFSALNSHPRPSDSPMKCPLCLEVVQGLKAYTKHVGRHQEDLSIFALPDKGLDVDEDDEQGREEDDDDHESATEDSHPPSEADGHDDGNDDKYHPKAREKANSGSSSNSEISSAPSSSRMGTDGRNSNPDHEDHEAVTRLFEQLKRSSHDSPPEYDPPDSVMPLPPASERDSLNPDAYDYVDPPMPSSTQPPFACDQCDRSFDQVHKLIHHKRYHERPHACPHPGCSMKFGTKTHLDRHINDKHSTAKKFHCTQPDCPWSKEGGKSFPRKDNWRRHMLNKHQIQPESDPINYADQREDGELEGKK